LETRREDSRKGRGGDEFILQKKKRREYEKGASMKPGEKEAESP